MYIKQMVEEERERNAESRAMLEQELIETRRSSEQQTQLAVLRAQLQDATPGRTVRILHYAVFLYRNIGNFPTFL